VGDEGGFAPSLNSTEEALGLIIQAIEKAGYAPGKDVSLALDCAASSFCKDGKYNFEGTQKTSDELIAIYESWLSRYPFFPLRTALRARLERLGQDDREAGRQGPAVVTIFRDHPKIFKKGIAEKIGNAY
jgi:enolase